MCSPLTGDFFTFVKESHVHIQCIMDVRVQHASIPLKYRLINHRKYSHHSVFLLVQVDLNPDPDLN